MDVSSPLRSLVPSLDSAVLEVLAGTEAALGTTQIVRLAGRGSRPGTQKVLDRLTGHGLVLAEPTNRGHIYRLNQEHILTPAIRHALDARTELLARMTDALKLLNPTPVHAAVFGSLARADGTPDSDIDLFLLMPAGFTPDDEWETQMRHLEDRVLAWSGNRLAVLAMGRDGLLRMVKDREALLDQLHDDAVPLIGDLREELATQVKTPRKTPKVHPPHTATRRATPMRSSL